MDRSIDWRRLESTSPHMLEGFTYAQLEALVDAGSILLIKAEVPALQGFWAKVMVVGCVVDSLDQYNDVVASIQRTNGRIEGYYSVNKDLLLNLLLAEL